MLPVVISENAVSLFKYWRDSAPHRQEGDRIQEGMSYNNTLYGQYRVYGQGHRLQAYDLACQMAAEGIQTCVTCSDARYAIWVNLQTLEQPMAIALS